MLDKTIDDVTREEWITLVEAAIRLLGSHRMMQWIAWEDDDKDDGSHEQADLEMCLALERIGLPQACRVDFNRSLEKLLKG